jgi:carboxylesterase
MTNITIMPGAAPYFHRGGSVGCLCLHGFTASPHEVLWYAQHLAQQGHTVYAPRLALHGTSPYDLARVRWWDLLNSALDGYHILRQQCDQVFVSGLSMGGVLALLTSVTVEVDGLIVMAAPMLLGGMFQPKRLRRMKLIRPYTDQTDRGEFARYVQQEQAKRGEPMLGRIRYGLWSTAALEQLTLMIEHTLTRLPEVTAPLLLIYSEKDQTVPLASQQVIAQAVRSSELQCVTLKQSGHILTQDIEHPEVFRLATEFIEKCRTAKPSATY